jgi:cytochrome c peroxidase
MLFRSRLVAWCALAAIVTALTAARPRADSVWTWELPAGVTPPSVPADNPMSAGKVELGRHLFYDTRLSGNGVQSCATCHQQERAFADMHPRSIGSTGDRHPRGSMSLVNVAYAPVLTWANTALTRLEDQALVPMFGDHPVELGLDRADSWLERLRADSLYPSLFRAAFPDDQAAVTRTNVVRALAAFQRSIVSMRSPYDRYRFDRDETAISVAARRGEALFQSRALSCVTCHGGVHFSGTMGSGRKGMTIELHNTGLYNLAGTISYPADNPGLYELTRNPGDVGKFKAPTLRNIAVTAPYMHDGSIFTLEEAIDHYAAGGRTIADGPYRGVGRDNPNKSPSIRGFSLTADQRADLVAFLRSLTDEHVLRDPRFGNPWPARGR